MCGKGDMMILPDMLDFPCVLVPAAPQESPYLNYTLLPATCPGFLIGYQPYTPPATLSPSNLATTIATNLSHQTSLQQVALATTQPNQATAVPFRPSLSIPGSSLTNGHRLPNGFQLNRSSFQGNKTVGGFRGGLQKTGFRPGFKRKLEEREENNVKVLREMMQPLYCKLCKVVLNAPAQAKQHYEGKNHLRKAKMFEEGKEEDDSGQEAQVSSTTSSDPAHSTSNNNSSSSSSPTRTGGVSHSSSLSASSSSPTSQDPIDPEIYCQTCGVSFNSNKQSQQHYQGKNHAKRVRAIQTEGQGGRKPWGHSSANKGSAFACTMCRVSMASKEHYDGHCLSATHQTQLTLLERSTRSLKGRWNGSQSRGSQGSGPFTTSLFSGNGSTSQPSRHNNHATTITNNSSSSPPAKKTRTDFVNFRLPSGKFYCSMCNMTINSEPAMAHHVDSRKHRAAFTAKKTEEMAEEAAQTS